MNPNYEVRPFPIPLVAAPGPGDLIEDETLDYLSMPQGMAMFHPPRLPEPEEIAACEGAVRVLQEVLDALHRVSQNLAPKRQTMSVKLAGLQAADVALLNQVLGEGEVSAQIVREDGAPIFQIQESVFAGVWRVLGSDPSGASLDYIEIGAVPEVLREVALADGASAVPAALPAPPHVMNVPSVLVELEDQRRVWRSGDLSHVVNLTLLPLTPEDIGYLDYRLGTGRVLILSRGYGNCRITNCCVPNTWRVVYYNSMDTVILNSVEVTDMPDVACAAPEDLLDSAERVAEVLKWVRQA
jgi:hydrogenase-1 operon protein HyaF